MIRRTFLKSIVELVALPCSVLFKNEINLAKLEDQCDKGFGKSILVYDETNTPFKANTKVAIVTVPDGISCKQLECMLLDLLGQTMKLNRTIIIKINKKFIVENHYREILLADQVIVIRRDVCEVIKSRYGVNTQFSYNSILG